MAGIRRCGDEDVRAILAVVNEAAEAYRGVIPADRWREPYMKREELEAEIAGGVAFWGYEDGCALVGVMGIQPLADVDLIRHAYVAPGSQGRGVGGALLAYLQRLTDRQVLVGTWAAAEWAIRFYRRHGFEQVTPEQKDRLLRTYWRIPERQVDTSVCAGQAAPPHLGCDERHVHVILTPATEHGRNDAESDRDNRGSACSAPPPPEHRRRTRRLRARAFSSPRWRGSLGSSPT
jgi:GNAT superfamily N-acetyltransferase